jgi:hypothetical protein
LFQGTAAPAPIAACLPGGTLGHRITQAAGGAGHLPSGLVLESHPFRPARFLFGQQYTYRAGDATIEVIPGLLHDWIEIDGQSTARIWIGRRNLNRQIWDALVRAGAHPIGSPPPA